MKTVINVNAKFAVTIFIFISAFVSCKKQGQCLTCFPKDAQNVSVRYETPNGIISFSNALATTSKDSAMKVCLANSDSRTYSRLNENLNTLTKDVHQTLQTILFINGYTDDKSSFSSERIEAIGRISRSGNNMLYFAFYLNKGGEFILIDDLSTNIPVLTGNSLEELFRRIVFPIQTKNTLVQITDIDNYDFKVKNHVDVLMKKIKIFQSANSASSLLPDEGESTCSNTFCLMNNGNLCEYRNGAYICYTRTSCFAKFLKEFITNNSLMTNDSIRTTFDSSLHYGIRNNILSTTDFGKKYKAYYNDLSIIYGYNTDISTILKTARLLSEMNTYFSNLKNYTTQGNQTFLTSGMKAKISNLITEYKAIYNDDYTEQIFQDIITDINWAENKTVNQVIPRFN